MDGFFQRFAKSPCRKAPSVRHRPHPLMKHVIEGTILTAQVHRPSGDDDLKELIAYYSYTCTDDYGTFENNSSVIIPLDHNSPMTQNDAFDLVGKKIRITVEIQ